MFARYPAPKPLSMFTTDTPLAQEFSMDNRALAARIVRRFKKDTFRIIEEEPERLAEVKGISQRKAMEVFSIPECTLTNLVK